MKLKSYLSYLIFISLFACAEVGQEAKSGFQEKMFDGDYTPELVNEAEAFGERVVSQTTEDFCEKLNWYGDGYCDTDCSSPDPDCSKEVASPWVNEDNSEVHHESNPWEDPQPNESFDENPSQDPWNQDADQQDPSQDPSQDPWNQDADQQDSWNQDADQQDSWNQDADQQDSWNQDANQQDPSQDPSQDSWNQYSDQQIIDNECPIESDGFCDANCLGDVDCDVCELYGFYGDAYCDEDCPQPDSDCF